MHQINRGGDFVRRRRLRRIFVQYVSPVKFYVYREVLYLNLQDAEHIQQFLLQQPIMFE